MWAAFEEFPQHIFNLSETVTDFDFSEIQEEVFLNEMYESVILTVS